MHRRYRAGACPTVGILHSERPAFAYDCRSYGWVAQLAEQWTENPRVGGSIPPPASPTLRRENTRETRLFWSAIFTASRIKALRAFTYSQLWPTGGGSRRSTSALTEGGRFDHFGCLGRDS